MDRWPQFCSNVKFEKEAIHSLMPEMKVFWPNLMEGEGEKVCVCVCVCVCVININLVTLTVCVSVPFPSHSHTHTHTHTHIHTHSHTGNDVLEARVGEAWDVHDSV
jgi:hypothetical protein